MRLRSPGLVPQIVIGVALGTASGLLFPDLARALGILGELFVGMLKAVAPLLVFVLVMSAIDNPVNALLTGNFLGCLTWAVLLGFGFRRAPPDFREHLQLGGEYSGEHESGQKARHQRGALFGYHSGGCDDQYERCSGHHYGTHDGDSQYAGYCGLAAGGADAVRNLCTVRLWGQWCTVRQPVTCTPGMLSVRDFAGGLDAGRGGRLHYQRDTGFGRDGPQLQ